MNTTGNAEKKRCPAWFMLAAAVVLSSSASLKCQAQLSIKVIECLSRELFATPAWWPFLQQAFCAFLARLNADLTFVPKGLLQHIH